MYMRIVASAVARLTLLANGEYNKVQADFQKDMGHWGKFVENECMMQVQEYS